MEYAFCDMLKAGKMRNTIHQKGTAMKNPNIPQDWKKEVELYIVAEEGAAYYVVNGEASDDFKVIL